MGIPAAAALLLWIPFLGLTAHARTKVWHDGVALWTDVLSRYPESPRGHLNRGAARAEAGDIAGAVGDYEQALRLMPDNAAIRFNLGNILVQGGRFDEAVAQYDLALAADPRYAPAFYYRGVAHEGAGRAEEALADYDRAIELIASELSVEER